MYALDHQGVLSFGQVLDAVTSITGEVTGPLVALWERIGGEAAWQWLWGTGAIMAPIVGTLVWWSSRRSGAGWAGRMFVGLLLLVTLWEMGAGGNQGVLSERVREFWEQIST